LLSECLAFQPIFSQTAHSKYYSDVLHTYIYTLLFLTFSKLNCHWNWISIQVSKKTQNLDIDSCIIKCFKFAQYSLIFQSIFTCITSVETHIVHFSKTIINSLTVLPRLASNSWSFCLNLPNMEFQACATMPSIFLYLSFFFFFFFWQ
jgi:hypothetical protein